MIDKHIFSAILNLLGRYPKKEGKMKLTKPEIETLIEWLNCYEPNDLMTENQLDAIENRNEKLRLKLVKEYKRLGENK
jgi:hypothetical protein